jgi:hypothetical protein
MARRPATFRLPTLCCALIILLAAGCQEKFDLATLPDNPKQAIDTSYIELSPTLGNFIAPRAILIGRDQLLYVADSAGNSLTMMNLAGQFMSARTMLHPISVAQDSRLDLLVGGEVATSSGSTAGAFFRIHLTSVSQDSAHRLDLARIDTVWTELARPARRFPGITVFGNNAYLVVRNGNDNSSFIDPDGRVMRFDSLDRFITPMSELATRSGTGITDINVPLGIASFPSSRDFVLTQSSDGVAYGAIWMIYQHTNDFDGWVPRFDPANTADRGSDFIRPGRFVVARAVAIDPIRRDIFIADAAQDSVFKFSVRGFLKSESFGFVRTSGAMIRPVGVAFFERVLYVLDGSRGVILRFRLTTDAPR